MYSFTRVWIGAPARDDADRHQRGGQDHERQRDAVDAHVIGAEAAEPGRFSTNWNSGEPGSKRQTSTSDTAKVTSVVHSATQRALRVAGLVVAAGAAMNSTPTSGRKVVTERIGQLGHQCTPAREHEPGDQRRRADQHGEGIVIEIAGLQPHHVAGDVEHARGHAVRPEAVDQPAVAALPEQAAEPQRRPHEDEVVDLVEVPLVEQEAVEHVVLAREPRRDVRPADVEVSGDAPSRAPSSRVGSKRDPAAARGACRR